MCHIKILKLGAHVKIILTRPVKTIFDVTPRFFLNKNKSLSAYYLLAKPNHSIMNSKYVISLFSLSLLLSSCYEEIPFFAPKEPVPARFPDVDKALWEHFEAFELEAASRGIVIDLASENLIALFTDIPADNVAGQCSYSYNHPRQVTIDIPFWNRSNQLSREMIVFHELGHCVLNLDHDERSFPSGLCRSIMRSGSCCCRDAYNMQNRNYYLDELFGLINEN
jgi:hypothetical protein